MKKKKGWDIFLERLENAITKITVKCTKLEDFITEKIQWIGKKIFRIADLTFLAFFVLAVLTVISLIIGLLGFSVYYVSSTILELIYDYIINTPQMAKLYWTMKRCFLGYIFSQIVLGTISVILYPIAWYITYNILHQYTKLTHLHAFHMFMYLWFIVYVVAYIYITVKWSMYYAPVYKKYNIRIV
jgi:hypothetical protein